MSVLTPRRKAILTAIWRGRPDYRELARTVGLVSPGDVHRHVDILRQGGYVNHGCGAVNGCRTLTLTGRGLLAAQGYELIYLCDQDGIHEVG